MRSKLSVVINTLNEEKNIARAINSIKDLADEIIVVDMKSDDKTVEVAKKLGATVYEHARTNYVEPARNFAISKTTGDWILILDADETVSHTLLKKIRMILKQGKAHYYRIPRKNVIFGKWMRHSRWWPDYNIRLFKKGYVSWGDEIHSIPITTGVGADLKALEKYALNHYHYSSLEQFIDRMNRYTSIQAKNKLKENYKFSWQDLISKPSNEFFSRFYFGKGYKDGLHGVAMAGLQAFSELVLYLKIWQLQGFEKQNLDMKKVLSEQSKVVRDYNYWKADTKVRQQIGISIVEKIKRKFRLP